jgi:hypothetical protein
LAFLHEKYSFCQFSRQIFIKKISNLRFSSKFRWSLHQNLIFQKKNVLMRDRFKISIFWPFTIFVFYRHPNFWSQINKCWYLNLIAKVESGLVDEWYRSRNRVCGCENGNNPTDFSQCIPIVGGLGIASEIENNSCPQPAKCEHWAQWGAWGTCSETCRKADYNALTQTCENDVNSASRTRSRSCNFGTIGEGNCPIGGDVQFGACTDDIPFCCEYSVWASWEDCQTDDGKEWVNFFFSFFMHCGKFVWRRKYKCKII